MKKKTKYLYVAIAISISLFSYFLASFVAGDGCMDSGGSWQYFLWQCDR
jgi:hypothetical protein